MPATKLAHAQTLVCLTYKPSPIRLMFGRKIVWVSNSLDTDETLSFSASHLKPCYLIFYYFSTGYNFLENFNLYKGLFDLSSLFENESFLILFWTHFLAANLFCGAWIVRDSLKFFISKYLILVPLLVTYFIGPVGLIMYWVIRIFYAKKIGFID